MISHLLVALVSISCLAAQPREVIRESVSEISAERIRGNIETLVGFGERNARVEPANTTRGIGAAREWIVRELRSYSTRLDVEVSEWPGAISTSATRTSVSIRYVKTEDGKEKPISEIKPVEAGSPLPVHNVIATLPGTTMPEKQILVTAHYDSAGGVGASDNASGTAAVMEVARVLSQHSFPKTLVFILFSAEEGGLAGSRLEAAKAKKEGLQIEGVLNADIVGNGPPPGEAPYLRVFGGTDRQAPTGRLASYVGTAGEDYTPVTIDLVWDRDRQGRSSDHFSYQDQGFAAVRFLTPYEQPDDHHTPNDTIEKVSFTYTALVASVMATSAASLAFEVK